MSKEAIIKIKEVEAEAQKIRADAEAQAKAKIRRAEADGKLLCDGTEADAARINAERLRLTRERAEELVSESLKSAEEQAHELELSCAPYMDEAVRLIVEGVFEQCQ